MKNTRFKKGHTAWNKIRKIKRSCIFCGNEFEVRKLIVEKYSKGKYCSSVCVHKAQSKKIKRTCLICSKIFEVKPVVVKRGSGKYCSRNCQFEGMRRAERRQNKTKRVCLICNKIFLVWPKEVRLGKAKYCSYICHSKAMYKQVSLKCNVCFKNFSVQVGRLKHQPKYCSRACSNIGIPMNLTEEQHRLRSESSKRNGYQKGHQHSLEVIEKLRAARAKQIYPKEYTSIEKAVYKILTDNNIFFKPQKPLEGICRVDAFIPPNKAIFCDGDYWHNLPSYKTRDARQNKILTEKGYKVIRLWEHEIKNDLQMCLERILQ